MPPLQPRPLRRRQRSRIPSLSAILSFLALLALPGCITINLAQPGDREWVETVVAGDSGPKVVLLQIDGLIEDSPQESLFGPEEPSLVARVSEQLDRAERDPDVAGLLLRIDSPGGTATASDLLHQALLRFRQEKEVPVVAQLMGTATSGAYYAAMAADHVVAHPTTVTGSIGVIFVGLEVSELMRKIGVGNQTLTGGEAKDAGTPLRPMTDAERVHLQEVIDDLHLRFREVVDEGRPGLDRSQVDDLADGRIFSARQALEAGLVDDIAPLEETISEVARRGGHPEVRVVRYHRARESKPTVYDRPPVVPDSIRLDLGSLLGPLGEPGFHYLWWPGRPSLP